jgi:polyhydroxybutyrate depolymerase
VRRDRYAAHARTLALLALAASGAAGLVGCGGASGPTAPTSASTGGPPEGEGVLGQWVASGGLQRTYALHLPPNYDGTRPFPLIVAFHGASGTHQFAEDMGLFKAADRTGFIVAAPDGVGGDWALGCGGCTLADRSGVDDVKFVGTLVTYLAQHLAIDRARVYAAGRSDGASFTYRLACDYTLTGIAVVSGTMFNQGRCEPARPIPLIAFHGTADPVIPFNGGVGPALLWASLNGCSPTSTVTALPDLVDDGTTVTRYEYGSCHEGADVTFFAVNGGGHAWPGSLVPYTSGGLQTRDIEASEEIVDFFARHPRVP